MAQNARTKHVFVSKGMSSKNTHPPRIGKSPPMNDSQISQCTQPQDRIFQQSSSTRWCWVRVWEDETESQRRAGSCQGRRGSWRTFARRRRSRIAISALPSWMRTSTPWGIKPAPKGQGWDEGALRHEFSGCPTLTSTPSKKIPYFSNVCGEDVFRTLYRKEEVFLYHQVAIKSDLITRKGEEFELSKTPSL